MDRVRPILCDKRIDTTVFSDVMPTHGTRRITPRLSQEGIVGSGLAGAGSHGLSVHLLSMGPLGCLCKGSFIGQGTPLFDSAKHRHLYTVFYTCFGPANRRTWWWYSVRVRGCRGRTSESEWMSERASEQSTVRAHPSVVPLPPFLRPTPPSRRPWSVRSACWSLALPIVSSRSVGLHAMLAPVLVLRPFRWR